VKAVFGIGNPGKEYDETRHNVGFKAVDAIARKVQINLELKNKLFLGANCYYEGAYFFLFKPLTYVNLSGKAFSEILNLYNLKPEDIIVVVDDINLPVGVIRIKQNGGDGGHNGIYSIINSINSDKFPRLRIGIGANFEKGKMSDYVLSKFALDEKEKIEDAIVISSNILLTFVKCGYEEALKIYSKLKQEKKI